MRLSPPTVGAIVCAAALGACGSSGNSGAGRKPAHNAFLAFSTCMRSHGVPNFPDPSAGGGISITPSSGVNPRAPAFQTAQQACQKLLPGGGPPKPSAAQEQTLVKLAQCMRQHGLTNFPDPTPFQGGGPPSAGAIVINGSEFKFPPGLDPKSPAFQQDMKACGGPGPP